VALARSSELASIGIDAEVDKALAPELVQMICTPSELRRVESRDAVVYFAAKEAFYKCQYPLTRKFLDFQDVELELDPARRTFRARVLVSLPAAPAALGVVVGQYAREHGLVMCGFSLPVRSIS
jgi:4'-phosphopantetheinyl transferase EntD